MAVVLWIMAILTNWTVFQRIWYTWREASRLERQELSLEIEEEEEAAKEAEVAAKASLRA